MNQCYCEHVRDARDAAKASRLLTDAILDAAETSPGLTRFGTGRQRTFHAMDQELARLRRSHEDDACEHPDFCERDAW